ncbi:glycosyltransferase family 39 protein [Salibacteraceae bacterium]|nr:glycosyltransferase family 39 protein [Bacteroidota bacterium]MDC1204644.1 glycosyltransferase family 39 protein [Salibacteraceae bacterium]
MKHILQLTYKQSVGLIGIIGLIIFASFNGQSHLFDWDEINFAEAAREMIVTGNYSLVLINYEPFWEKPPLFFWLQALCMNLFGINEFSARLPNAIAGALTGITLYSIGRKNFSNSFGWLWAMVYCSALLPILYFKSGIIDPWFNLFIFYGTYATWKAIYNSDGKHLLWSLIAGASIGLGIMTKGPVALLVILMVFGVFYLWKRFKVPANFSHFFGFTISLFVVGGLWFFIEYISGRGYIIEDFIEYQIRLMQTQDAGHGGPFYYHFIVLLIGCFPMSIFALGGFTIQQDKGAQKEFQRIMLLLFALVLLLFSVVNTKIIHYSSLCYFPLSFFAANFLNAQLNTNDKENTIQKITLPLIGGLLLIVFFALPFIGNHIDVLRDATWIKDDFAKANFEAENTWSALDYLLPLIFATGLFLFFSINGFRRYLYFMAAMLVSYFIILTAFVPKIEAYTQRAAIEFYESKANEDCYVTPVNYKSYAHLFYTQKPNQQNENHSNSSWLINGKTDKPVYCVLKITSSDEFAEKNTQFKLLYKKNGFAFFEKIQNK